MMRMILSMLLLGLSAVSALAADNVTAIFSMKEDVPTLTYLSAQCADSPECELASMTCEPSGLLVQLIYVSDTDAGEMLKDASGITIRAGKQSAKLSPTRLVINELDGGWIVDFQSWLNGNEENLEVMAVLAEAPLELENVSKEMDIDLPFGPANMAEQRKFAAACKALQSINNTPDGPNDPRG